MTDEAASAAGPAPAPARPLRRFLLLVVAIWAGWAVALLVFQEVAVARLQPDRPDQVLSWTAQETGVRRFGGRPYLAEPTLGSHVAFDSEYYLSIAVVGYDDPEVPQYGGPDGDVPLNYAFLPAYPFVMRVVATPLGWLGMEPIAAVAVAGVVVSLAAALGAAIAMFLLARRHLGDAAGVRAAFYLLVFPTGFFLAQVYSESLFLAASLAALVCVAERRPYLAAPFAVVAVLTRSVGIALVLAIAVGLAVAFVEARKGRARLESRELVGWAIALVAPLVAYLAWSASALGRTFELVEREYFGRALLNLETAWNGWSNALGGLEAALPETRVYYVLEVIAVIVAVAACAWAARRWPAASIFGLAALVVAITSGEPQGMIRYVLAVPPLFLMLGSFGRHPAFDRTWTVVSVLLMGLLAAIYSFDFWVA